MPDKREIVSQFQDRLKQLIERRDENLSAFARRCGMDRSALSQFLDTRVSRLPRAETLCAIAVAEAVSVDWLLGLSQSQQTLGEVARVVSIETAADGIAASRLAEWHREAIGYKIRYVPATLPDLLRTEAVLTYEFRAEQPSLIDAKTGQAKQQLDYTRRPETDMEIVMPYQQLYSLASGSGIWSNLARGARAAQIEHMAELLDELYPTLRLFLYDGLKAFSAPFTVFGPKRAAIYLGEMYLVVNAVDHIRALAERFDHLIRIATVSADRAPAFINQLKVT